MEIEFNDQPAIRYVIKNGDRLLSTSAGVQSMDFDSKHIYDAIKFATVEDAQKMIEHLFDVSPPTKWDGKTNARDPDAPQHLGAFYGQDKSTVKILATHT